VGLGVIVGEGLTVVVGVGVELGVIVGVGDGVPQEMVRVTSSTYMPVR